VLGLSAVILISSTAAAGFVEKSRLSQQSRILRAVIDAESVGLWEMIFDRQNLIMLTNFVVAVADAYIHFELIPLNEAETFAVIFDSLNDGTAVDGFEYSGRNLTIHGVSESERDFRDFLENLERKDYFGETEIVSADGVDVVRFLVRLQGK